MQSPMNYSKNARPEHAGLRSADHSTRIVGSANARPFACPVDEVAETGLEMLLKAGVKSAPKVARKS